MKVWAETIWAATRAAAAAEKVLENMIAMLTDEDVSGLA